MKFIFSQTGISILFGIAIFIIVITLYPRLEEIVVKKFKNRLDFFQDKIEKMFLANKIKFNMILAIAFGPPILFIMLGIFISYSLPSGAIFPIVITSVFALLGWFLPVVIFAIGYGKRVSKFNDQLLDALSMLGNSLKSGLSLLQGIQVVVDNMENPISQEFNLMLSEHRLGTSIDDALINLGARIPSDDVHLVVNSIVILRETGGDLTETFDTITSTIRERKKVDGKIKSLTAMGMTQGGILIAFPFVLGMLFYMMNPDVMKLFFTTKLGWGLIVFMLIMQSMGAFAILKIVKIDV